MRILLTWELGLNFGHLTRLLPVARELKDRGHIVLVATRDVQAAASVLGQSGIPFVQAPHLPKGIPLEHRATGFSDILLSQGWADRSALWGLTQAWLNIFQLFRPDRLILDYSPTTSLAARIVGISTISVGNGFELPPLQSPFPPFPGFSWATAEMAEQSEGIAVANANAILVAHKKSPIGALSDLSTNEIRLLATLPELDHYGHRKEADYVGPVLTDTETTPLDWPDGNGPKLFACLRPDTSRVQQILVAFKTARARIICVAIGFTPSQLGPYQQRHIRYSLNRVNLSSLLDADLSLTYGAEGTTIRMLSAGIPQLVSPWHVETFMAVRRLVSLGMGRAIAADAEASDVSAAIDQTIEFELRGGHAAFFAASFAERRFNPIQRIVDAVVGLHPKCSVVPVTSPRDVNTRAKASNYDFVQ
jgi:UDP:flavonoid glycosyltransferase YjiC (YdhE family)